MAQNGIHKAAGLIIENRKLLISRSKGKDIFINLGGKLELGETPEQALIRELKEEQGIIVTQQDISLLGTYHSIAAGHEAEQLQLRLDAFFVHDYEGKPSPQAEIDENMWVDSSALGTVPMASLLEHEIIPELKKRDLID